MSLRYLPEHAAREATEMLFRTVAAIEAEAVSLGLRGASKDSTPEAMPPGMPTRPADPSP